MKGLFTGVALSITIMGSAHADLSGADHAVLMWNAFACSVYAEKNSDEKEQERLFNIGYRRGHKFIEAARNNQINQEEYNSKVPWIVTASLGVPSEDFMLGRIFCHASDYAYKTYDANLNEEQNIYRFKQEFWEANCGLLGQ